jgi:hypothetical protein
VGITFSYILLLLWKNLCAEIFIKIIKYPISKEEI